MNKQPTVLRRSLNATVLLGRSISIGLIVQLIAITACAPPVTGAPLPPPAQQTQPPPTSPVASSTQVPPPVAAPTQAASLPVIATPANTTELFCLASNPPCQDKTLQWWEEWNDTGDTSLVTFAFAPGVVAEARFAEAVLLLEQWSEGQQLLTTASRVGVRITGLTASSFPTATEYEVTAYFTVVNGRPGVFVNDAFARLSTFELADILGHELTHLSDFAAGIDQGTTASDCVAREVRARQTEQRFLHYLDARFGLPGSNQVAAALAAPDNDVFQTLHEILTTRDIAADTAQQYHAVCAQ